MRHESMRRVRTALIAALFLAGSASADAQPCASTPGHFVAQLENDMKGWSFRDSDAAYTAGERVLWSDVGLDADGKGPLGTTWPYKHDERSCLSWTLGAASNLYTPSNIETPDLQINDRPYGSWLYGMYRVSRSYRTIDPAHPSEIDFRGADSIELDAGILGPGAAGKYFQNTVHKLFNVKSRIGPGIKLALGWHHQLRNEPALNVQYLQRRRVLGPPASDRSRHYDVVMERGGALGTVFTWLNGGGVARFGSYVPNDLGPVGRQLSVSLKDVASRRTRLQDSATRRAPPATFAYVFVRVEGRVVLRNAFLDGNLIADDRVDRGRVQKRPAVGDLDLGFVVQACRYFSFAYRNVLRSPEFRPVPGVPPFVDAAAHRFGSLTFQVGRLF
jgi:lipid A 3-O-deacylase